MGHSGSEVPVLDDQIERARQRAQGIDLARLAATQRGKPPELVASDEEKEKRRQFLRADLGNAQESKIAFERIIEGNELQPINYLQLGELASRSVCRIKLFDARDGHCGWGTGFLIAPRVLVTNNHVFPSDAWAQRSVAQFDVQLDVFGGDAPTVEFAFTPQDLFYTSQALDFTVVAVAPVSAGGKALSHYGFLPLISATGKVMEGEWLTIIQHPGGERKQVCVRENRLLTRTDDVLWYSTDTLGGSSGSPVFNNGWQVVALHHKGVPEEKNGRIQTVDGRDFDPGRDQETSIKWIANEGIRVSRIVETLATERPGHALLGDVFDMSPARAREITAALVAGAPPQVVSPSAEISPQPAPPTRSVEMSRSVTVTLDIADDGRVFLRGAGAAAESAAIGPLGAAAAWVEAPRAPAAGRGPNVEVEFDFDYAARGGYDPDFLGQGYVVHPPSAGADLRRVAARLLAAPETSADPADYTLKYTNYSVMMHATRRLALWTAASVDGGNRYSIGRTTDTWRFDPRIGRDVQLGAFYYKNNQFDRGHLTRREDMEYGPSVEAAVAAADDTCHWTNCSPQHSKFNQLGNLWQNLEKHILEKAIRAEKFGAQVMTGPILAEDDPVWSRFPDIQYPVRFWKIAVAVNGSGALFATGFVLDQSAAIAKFGVEAAGDTPFGPFETFQVPIAEIEDLTGLVFTYAKDGKTASLREVDPLARPQARAAIARRASAGALESATFGTPAAAGYTPLIDGGEIVF